MSIDTQRMIDTATAYFLAGERCEFDLRFGPYDLHIVSAPAITSYAFAVELSLKLIYFLTTNSTASGHSLAAIFSSLPDETKDRLVHLGECAEEIDRYFVDWRYPFERDFLIGDTENPRRAFIECYREIRQSEPTLMSVYECNWGGFEPEWIRNSLVEEPYEIRRLGTHD